MTNDSTKHVIYQLAKGISEKKSTASYGRLRSKLQKQGFSEIALYSAAARHCQENSIPPEKYIKDMLALIEGCGRDLFFPKNHNDFHYLRREYHDIRDGNLEKGEDKSPEQRGMYLCNICFLVKDKKERCKGANEKYTCSECKKEKSKASYADNKKKKPVRVTEEATPKETTPEHHYIPASMNKEENTNMPSTTPEPTKSFANILGSNVIPPENSVKITEVMADEKGATISISCPTAQLHLVLAALSPMTS